MDQINKRCLGWSAAAGDEQFFTSLGNNIDGLGWSI